MCVCVLYTISITFTQIGRVLKLTSLRLVEGLGFSFAGLDALFLHS